MKFIGQKGEQEDASRPMPSMLLSHSKDVLNRVPRDRKIPPRQEVKVLLLIPNDLRVEALFKQSVSFGRGAHLHCLLPRTYERPSCD